MIACMLAAPASGTGKTAVTCALLAALAKRGLSPCAFKCGPDYIDPMFHRSVLGVESRNLDLFFCSEERLRELYARGSAGHGAAVVEGVMGYYDGVGGTTDRASAWHAAHTLGLPVILVLRPQGSSLTLAAQVRGLMGFRTPHHIAGILLNRCSETLAKSLAPMLERETGIPVLGFLPEMPEAAFESRHLGLFTAGEISDLSARIDAMAQQLEKTVDLSRLLALCECEVPCAPEPETTAGRAVIAVAKDEAFCFVYEETLEALRDAGAKIVPFSPLGQGFLTGALKANATFDKGFDFRKFFPRFSPEALKANQRFVEKLKALADERGATPAQIALAWLLAQKPWIVPIPGTTKLHRLKENLASVDVRLSDADLRTIGDSLAEIEIYGDRFPESYEKGTGI